MREEADVPELLLNLNLPLRVARQDRLLGVWCRSA
jgi:hypothetical protein